MKNNTYPPRMIRWTWAILFLSVSSVFAQEDSFAAFPGISSQLGLAVNEVTIEKEDFNNGLIYSFEQLINGKVAGLQITPYGGSPNAGNRILIRGGASLMNRNNPLIILDGFPLDADGSSGNKGNILSFLNPEDIESISILKDASATAMYGARGADGVLLINTKRAAEDKWKVRFKTTSSLQTNPHASDMLSASQFKEVIRENGYDIDNSLLGYYSTDWNDVIYHTAFATDNTLSISGRSVENLPFRASIGYYDQEGILKTDDSRRYSGNISLFPSFLDNHLTFNIHFKGTSVQNNIAPRQALLYGARYNPTDPVYSRKKEYGGYYETIHPNMGTLPRAAIPNPLGVLEQTSFTNNIKRYLSIIGANYTIRSFPELSIGLSGAYDYEKGEGEVSLSEESAWYFLLGRPGPNGAWQKNTNKFYNGFLQYKKNFPEIKSRLEAVAGYNDQRREKKMESYSYPQDEYFPEIIVHNREMDDRLRSYYGNIYYAYDSRYSLTLNVRRDGSSFFNKKNRWQNFSSVALAWNISEESFLKEFSFLDKLRIRGSYGTSGQLPGRSRYSSSAFGYEEMYDFGPSSENQYYRTSSVTILPVTPDTKGETITSSDIGMDIRLFNSRINAFLDYYTRDTKDIYTSVFVASGTDTGEWFLANGGGLKHRGLDFSLDVWPVVAKDIRWQVGFNLSWQKKTAKNVNKWGDSDYITIAGDGYYSPWQVLAEGCAPYTFSVYKQIYDVQGRPIEGIYEDFNEDTYIGIGDEYLYHSPEPDIIMGLNTHFQYKKWSLGMSFRAHTGNYVYNGVAASTGALFTSTTNFMQLKNLHKSYLETGFNSPQYLSSHYIENASFLKMDHLSLGYNFGKIAKGIGLHVEATV
ncbi:MAG: SusC/RagA family TonB-linked outer membrane protein [Candidatus Azobacteroides sp.]|nr:SusC/RagA family TonB-linked outer membrane protein [Candidatus Azobacteroides sp.]